MLNSSPSAFLAIALVFTTASCHSFHAESFKLDEKYTTGAPALKLEIETENFSHAGWRRIVRECYEREIPANLLPGSSAPNPVGTVKVVAKLVDESAGWPWIFPTVLSLTTLNLIGIPGGSRSASIDIELTISARDGTKIATYKGSSGSQTAFAALYWGYNGFGWMDPMHLGDVHQAVMCKAALAALADAGKKMRDDKSLNWDRLR